MCYVVRKFICFLSFVLLHVILKAFAGCFQYVLDLRYSDHREVFGEQEVAGKEQTEGAHVETNLRPGRTIVSPAGGQAIAGQWSTDDHETLKPHTDVHDDGHNESYHYVPSHLAEPEHLGSDHVTGHHDPVRPTQRTGSAVFVESIEFVLHTAIPCHEQLSKISATYDRTCQYDHLVHGFHVTNGDVVFQV